MKHPKSMCVAFVSYHAIVRLHELSGQSTELELAVVADQGASACG